MQTAQLTFNGQIVTEFFSVLFRFQSREKDRNIRDKDLFLYFSGALWC